MPTHPMRWIACILLLAVSGAQASTPDVARAALAGCIAGLETRIVEDTPAPPDCRKLEAVLDDNAALLPVEIRPYSTETLQSLDLWLAELQREIPAQLASPAALAPILAALDNRQTQREPGFWERFLEWLRQKTQPREDVDPPAWVQSVIESLDAITPEMIRIFFLLVLALILISLAIVVIRELRAARSAQTKGDAGLNRGDDGSEAGLAAAQDPPLSADTDEAPALLHYVIARLANTGCLPGDRSLTNGELLGVLKSHRPDFSAPFAALVRAAENQLFGGQRPSPSELTALQHQARALAGEA